MLATSTARAGRRHSFASDLRFLTFYAADINYLLFLS